MVNIDRNKLRYNLINLIIYIVGIILVVRLFNLQIVHGKEYREISNTRLTRETKVNATRGSILDRTGIEIVGNKMGFELQLYKSKIDTQLLNETILKVINILEKNGDTYTDTLPIKINPFEFTYTGDYLASWKKSNSIPENASAEEAFYSLKQKYEISNDNIEEARKIMIIRYRIQTEGYSTTNPIIISTNISRQSKNEFDEQSGQFPGIDAVVRPMRDYKCRKLSISYNRIYGKNKRR